LGAGKNLFAGRFGNDSGRQFFRLFSRLWSLKWTVSLRLPWYG
jgi:hypothetical protein